MILNLIFFTLVVKALHNNGMFNVQYKYTYYKALACAGFILAGEEKNISWGMKKSRWGRITPEGREFFFCPPPPPQKSILSRGAKTEAGGGGGDSKRERNI